MRSNFKQYTATVLVAISCALGSAASGHAQAARKSLDPAEAQRVIALRGGLVPQVWTTPKLASNAVSFRRVRTSGGPVTNGKVRAHGQTPAINEPSGQADFAGLLTPPSYVATAPEDPTVIFASAGADVDGQNGLDIVTVQSDGTLNVLLNDGHGKLSLTSSNSSAVALNPKVAYIEVADLNKDGHPDVVAADISNSALLVFINLGNGQFGDPLNIPVQPASEALLSNGGSFTIGDVDHDGNMDLVAVSSVQTPVPTGYTSTLSVQVFRGHGDGTFITPRSSIDSTFGTYIFVQPGQAEALVDLNGDGNLDLVTEYVDPEDYTVGVTGSLGKGNGTFAPFTLGTKVSGQMYLNSTLQLVDLNKDGLLDATFAIGDGNIWVARGAGDGTFRAPEAGLQNVPAARIFRFGDFNSDGLPDVLVYSFGSVASFPGHGDGSFGAVPNGQFGSSIPGTQEPVPGDFNGDGKLDFVNVDYGYGTASLYLGVGDGSFLAERAIVPLNEDLTTLPNAAQSPDNYQVVATGDYNGDGKADVLTYDFTDPYQGIYPDIRIGISDGKGGFTFTTGMTGKQFAATNPDGVLPVFADLNKDGIADLLLQTATGIVVAFGQPNGVFGATHRIPLPVYAQSCAFGSANAADLNNDGNLDLLIAYQGYSSACFGRGSLSGYFTLLGDGTGNFTATYTQYATSVSLIKLADINGDGILDLVADDAYSDHGSVICVSCPSHVTVLRGIGDGTFDTANPYEVLSDWRIANTAAGDYDGDGKTDLALFSNGKPDESTLTMFPDTQGVLLLKGRGDFTFARPVEIATDTFATDGSFVDLNGDGKPELLFNLDTSFQDIPTYYGLVVLPNEGGTFGAPINYLAPEGAGQAFVADFNGDGLPDILDQDAPSVLFLNGGGSRLSLNVSPTSLTQGSTAVLQANLAVPAGTETPTGSVAFFVNGSTLGTADLVDGVTAQLTGTTLPVGNDTITATYAGDGNHRAAKSASVMVTVAAVAPTFTLNASAQSVNVLTAQSGTLSLSLAANPSFTGSVTFACSGLPAGMTCTFSPASVDLTGTANASAQVVIAQSALAQGAQPRGNSGWAGTATTMALLPFLLMINPRLRRRLSGIQGPLFLVLLCFASVMGTSGCSDGGSKTTTTNSIVIITATGISGSATVVKTAVVSVISAH